MVGNKWGNNAKIVEIYCLSDNEKECFVMQLVKKVIPQKEISILTNKNILQV